MNLLQFRYNVGNYVYICVKGKSTHTRIEIKAKNCAAVRKKSARFNRKRVMLHMGEP